MVFASVTAVADGARPSIIHQSAAAAASHPHAPLTAAPWNVLLPFDKSQRAEYRKALSVQNAAAGCTSLEVARE